MHRRTPTSFKNHLSIRRISWSFKSWTSSPDPSSVPDPQEDLTKAAILDKVMKGRQPTDLMLRCSSSHLVVLVDISPRF